MCRAHNHRLAIQQTGHPHVEHTTYFSVTAVHHAMDGAGRAPGQPASLPQQQHNAMMQPVPGMVPAAPHHPMNQQYAQQAAGLPPGRTPAQAHLAALLASAPMPRPPGPVPQPAPPMQPGMMMQPGPSTAMLPMPGAPRPAYGAMPQPSSAPQPSGMAPQPGLAPQAGTVPQASGMAPQPGVSGMAPQAPGAGPGSGMAPQPGANAQPGSSMAPQPAMAPYSWTAPQAPSSSMAPQAGMMPTQGTQQQQPLAATQQPSSIAQQPAAQQQQQQQQFGMAPQAPSSSSSMAPQMPGMAPQPAAQATGMAPQAPAGMAPQPSGMAPVPGGGAGMPYAQPASQQAVGYKRPPDGSPSGGDASTSPTGYDHPAKRQRPDDAAAAAGQLGMVPTLPASMGAGGTVGGAAPLAGPQAAYASPPQAAAAANGAAAADAAAGAMLPSSGAAAAAPAAAAAAPKPAPPPRRRVTEDERRLLPKRGIAMAMKAAGLDKDFTLDPAAEAAIMEFYQEWIANALAFGCEMAKRRKATALKARDVSLHLERSWHLYVPGFSGDQLRPYRRANVSELHRQRHLAVKRTAADMEVSLATAAANGGVEVVNGTQ